MSSYTTFVKGTTISAEEMNDNFNHIGAGTWTPYSGATLTTDTSALLDLGNQTKRWDTLYCNNINLDGELTQAFNLIAEVTLSVTAGKIEFDNLNGDQDEIYIIKCRITNSNQTTTAYDMVFNQDSATNYGRQILVSENAAVSASRATDSGVIIGFITNDTATSQISYSENIVYSKTGNERTILSEMQRRGSGTFIGDYETQGYIWNNISETITTIGFIGNTSTSFDVNTNIQIWAKVSTITSRSISITTS